MGLPRVIGGLLGFVVVCCSAPALEPAAVVPPITHDGADDESSDGASYYTVDYRGTVGVTGLVSVYGSASARLGGQVIELFGMADCEIVNLVFHHLDIGASRTTIGGEDVLRLETFGTGILMDDMNRLRLYYAQTDIPIATLQEMKNSGAQSIEFANTTIFEFELELETLFFDRACTVAVSTAPAEGQLSVRWAGRNGWEIGDPLELVLTTKLTTDPEAIAGEGPACECYDGGGETVVCPLRQPLQAPIDCDHIPSPRCAGSAAHCGELALFDPAIGPGYVDVPIALETWDDQYRSYLRRDVAAIIRHAAVKTACLSRDWEDGNGMPLMLADMSEKDGSIPGTSIAYPTHPRGSHTAGYDIDVGYYQTAFFPNNYIRTVCDHYVNRRDALRCVGPPHGLDVRRNALFTALVEEQPLIRCVGVDGVIGPLLEETQRDLFDEGLITREQLEANKLCYEEEDNRRGWFRSHHNHIHISAY